MTPWSAADLTEIPPASAFPTEDFETRAAMVERFHELGTLLAVGATSTRLETSD